jgi:hypothetical protein
MVLLPGMISEYLHDPLTLDLLEKLCQTKWLLDHIQHFHTFLLKSFAASSKLSRILSNSSGRAKSRSYHNMKKQNKWETKGFISITNCKKSLRKIQRFNLDQPTQDHGRVSQNSYLSASFILKNS